MNEKDLISLYGITTVWTHSMLEALQEKIETHLSEMKSEDENQDILK